MEKILKRFTVAAGLGLVVVGIMNFFAPGFETTVVHAVMHIVAGVLIIALTLRSDPLPVLKWFTILMLVLATLAFAGVSDILGTIKFAIFVKWSYPLLGLLGMWVYLSTKESASRA